MRPFVIVAAMLALLVVPALAVDLSGDISGTLPAGVHTVTDDIHVPAGQTLVLQAGCVLEFEDSFWSEYELTVDGVLLAQGTAAAPVVLRAAAGVPEYNYIRLRGEGSELRFCRVEDVGSVSLASEGGLWIDGCSPRLEDCEVVGAGWHGIDITGSAARPTIIRTWVHGGDGDGIDADEGAGLLLENCRIEDNGGDGVCLAGGENLLVGCLVVDNGEDGIDSHGLQSHAADLVNCTVGPHPSEAFSDDGAYRLFNCIAVTESFAGTSSHSVLCGDAGFLGLNADWTLADDARVREHGRRFELPCTLPATDLAGRPRLNGIIDPGCFEATGAPDPGTDGDHFSRALVSPRATYPTVRVPGETLTVHLARLGSYTPGDVAMRLVGADGTVVPLTVAGVTAHEVRPSSEWVVRYRAAGLETLQEITATVPAAAGGLCRLEVSLDGLEWFSDRAVQVLDAYPDRYTIMHITDTHIGYIEEEFTATERLRFFVTECNAVNPAFVLVTGDILENFNRGNEAWVDQFLDATAGLRMPMLVLPGNHDHYNGDGNETNLHGWFEYFETISRLETCDWRFGDLHIFGMNARHELGLLEFYRCAGPNTRSLDWVEDRLAALPAAAGPLIFAFHGPNYDYMSWNDENVDRVRDLMDQYGVVLGLAGHTHRFEAYRNAGDNHLGRNDYVSDDDWVRDVAFPGYPIHLQTSSLGKDEHLSAAMQQALARAGVPAPPRPAVADKGLFGDSIGWRAIRIEQGQVAWFSADLDGDGHRNTETAWVLGEIACDVQTDGDAITSTITNGHHQEWVNGRHWVPGVMGSTYSVTGGSLVRQWSDGVLEIAVDAIPAGGVSQVVVRTVTTASEMPAARSRLLGAAPNPFNPRTEIRLELAATGHVRLEIFDTGGRRVRVLADHVLPAGRRVVTWDGRDDTGRGVPSGTYLARLETAGAVSTVKMLLAR